MAEAPGVTATVENGLAALRAENAFGSVLVYRHGAHVSEYLPAAAPAVLFTSSESRFARTTAIRGGIPICFPWFGAHPTRKELASHGFARTSEFEYQGSRTSAGGGTTLRFSLMASDATREAFPHDFALDYELTLEQSLSLKLRVKNTGQAPFTFEAALHSYFAVSDVRRIRVFGLEGEPFLDQLSGRSQVEPQLLLEIASEVDRVYHSSAVCRLNDPGLGRAIVVSKAGSSSTVVWNPWIEKSKRLADFGDEEYVRMLCIESANVRPHGVTLGPSEVHELQVSIESVRLDG